MLNFPDFSCSQKEIPASPRSAAGCALQTAAEEPMPASRPGGKDSAVRWSPATASHGGRETAASHARIPFREQMNQENPQAPRCLQHCGVRMGLPGFWGENRIKNLKRGSFHPASLHPDPVADSSGRENSGSLNGKVPGRASRTSGRSCLTLAGFTAIIPTGNSRPDPIPAFQGNPKENENPDPRNRMENRAGFSHERIRSNLLKTCFILGEESGLGTFWSSGSGSESEFLQADPKGTAGNRNTGESFHFLVFRHFTAAWEFG